MMAVVGTVKEFNGAEDGYEAGLRRLVVAGVENENREAVNEEYCAGRTRPLGN
jgi:hypothetical protein